MAEKASYWRNHLKTRLTSVTERRRFWERVFRGRFASLMHAGNETAAQKILEDELDNPGSTGGEIILVGAGPGDAGLLTLRGLQVLQDADVVFYDHRHRRRARADPSRRGANLRRQTGGRTLGAAARHQPDKQLTPRKRAKPWCA